MRLIDADKLKEHIKQYAIHSGIQLSLDRYAFKVIEEEPIVDAVPVRHGKWKWLSCTYDRIPKEKEYECSECHHKTIVHGDELPWEKYCPNCGARMEETKE